jgi:hypothetical protein
MTRKTSKLAVVGAVDDERRNTHAEISTDNAAARHTGGRAASTRKFNGAPQVLAAVQKRFPKATAIEQIGDENVWFEWRGERWMCALRNPSMRPIHCMTNQNWDLMRARQ